MCHGTNGRYSVEWCVVTALETVSFSSSESCEANRLLQNSSNYLPVKVPEYLNIVLDFLKNLELGNRALVLGGT
jgi:hypothetical protein